MSRPRFVKVKLLKNGWAELIDNDGEVYHVEMHADLEWPILSRCERIRAREMRRMIEQRRKEAAEQRRQAAEERRPPPTTPFKPKLVS
jgi:hypothetical protein